ncbi:MAG: hypothetical protein PHS37_06605 [Candidatus Omnitrophica bacterium]|nr:hypothetical protein [Candidatus Omnitrophota bacterium]
MRHAGYHAKDDDNLVFAYTNSGGKAAEALSGIGPAVRPVQIDERGSFVDKYYPVAEVIALSLAQELLGLDRDTFVASLKAAEIDLDGLGIEINDDPSKTAYLIFRLIPKIDRFNTGEFGDRFTRLAKFLQSA